MASARSGTGPSVRPIRVQSSPLAPPAFWLEQNSAAATSTARQWASSGTPTGVTLRILIGMAALERSPRLGRPTGWAARADATPRMRPVD
jgi:hypothetical protein